MGMGGGAKAPDPTYQDPETGRVYKTPYELNIAIQQREDAAKQKSAADALQKAQDDALARGKFEDTKVYAKQDAMTQAMQAFRDAGADPNAYMEQYINPTINRFTNSIQDMSPNVYGAFPASLGQDIVNQALSASRGRAGREINQAFDPTWTTTNLPDTAIDPYVSQIVGEQFDPLMTQLQNAQKRGTLSDTGYQAALDAYNSKKSAASDTVRNLAMNVLGGQRSQLGEYITGAKNAAGNIGLSDMFSVDPYVNQARGMVSSDIAGLGGAIRSQVGDTKFAALPDLLSAGGVVQGPNNPAVTNPAMAEQGAGALANTILDEKKRGLGSSGAF